MPPTLRGWEAYPRATTTDFADLGFRVEDVGAICVFLFVIVVICYLFFSIFSSHEQFGAEAGGTGVSCMV